MSTFVSGSLLQVFKSQGEEEAQASTHTLFSEREPLLWVELSAPILHFGYLQGSITCCVLTGTKLSSFKGMTGNFLLEYECVRKACADISAASNSCQACFSFPSNAIALTSHVQVMLTTWWAIQRACWFPLHAFSPTPQYYTTLFCNNLLNCFKYCAAVSSICSFLTIVWPPLFTIFAMVKLMSKMAKTRYLILLQSCLSFPCLSFFKLEIEILALYAAKSITGPTNKWKKSNKGDISVNKDCGGAFQTCFGVNSAKGFNFPKGWYHSSPEVWCTDNINKTWNFKGI